jgi:molybdopterin-binding protein
VKRNAATRGGHRVSAPCGTPLKWIAGLPYRLRRLVLPRMNATKFLAGLSITGCLLTASLLASDAKPAAGGPTIITYIDTPTAKPRTDGSTSTFLSPEDEKVAALATYGAQVIERIGGMLVSEVNRELTNREVHEAVSIMHLKSLELPKPVAGKPVVTAIKRTSLMIRDPRNAPDNADAEALDRIHQQLMNNETPDKVMLQKIEQPGKPVEYRVYRPIAATPSCLACHGDPKTFKPGVKAALDLLYPEDKAIDYSAREWRGILRVSLSLPEAPAAKK